VRKIAEWVSLYSPWRGLNRFQLVLKIFQALEENFPSIGNAVGTPRLHFPTKALEQFVNSGVALSNDELKKWNDPALQGVLDWSLEVSRQIAQISEMPVFDEVFQGLEKLHEAADLIVVSQTTEEALVREWRHTGLDRILNGAFAGEYQEDLISRFNAVLSDTPPGL
jgi:hypothetical protein